MNDVVALQQGIFHGLRSCGLFNSVNIVLAREMLMQSQIEQDTIWLTPRGGCRGLGMIVQIPKLLFPKPNSLQRLREFSIGIYEERNMNFTPSIGTMITAEDWGDLVVDFLWNWRLWRASGLILQDSAIVPDERYPGIIGLSARVYLRQERHQPPRAVTPAITIDESQLVTLTVADDSKIYYTTDGYSFPGPANEGKLVGEQPALLYTEPFQAQSGQIVMAMAHGDSLPSQLVDLEIP